MKQGMSVIYNVVKLILLRCLGLAMMVVKTVPTSGRYGGAALHMPFPTAPL